MTELPEFHVMLLWVLAMLAVFCIPVVWVGVGIMNSDMQRDRFRDAIATGEQPVSRLWAEGPYQDDSVRVFVATPQCLRAEVSGTHEQLRGLIAALRQRKIPVAMTDIQSSLV